MEILEAYEKKHNPKEVLLGHGWQPEKWNRQDGEQMLEENYSDRPVILFAADRSTCMMNLAAKKKISVYAGNLLSRELLSRNVSVSK